MNIITYEIKVNLSKRYKIAVISDLHGNSGLEVIKSIEAQRPDIIAICGDLVDSNRNDWPTTMIFLEKCTSISRTYLSFGNHDYVITINEIELMKDKGVHVLNDEWELFNDEICIGGLTSSFYHKCEQYDPKIKMDLIPNINWLNQFEKIKKYKILLDHHPENYEPYTRNRDINLILSGHNHGGQIRLFGRGLYARNQGLFPKYDGGIYDGRLIVSRGLANTMLIPRLWNPTELVYIDLIIKN